MRLEPATINNLMRMQIMLTPASAYVDLIEEFGFNETTQYLIIRTEDSKIYVLSKTWSEYMQQSSDTHNLDDIATLILMYKNGVWVKNICEPLDVIQFVLEVSGLNYF